MCSLEDYYRQGLSDHAPLVVFFERQTRARSCNNSIPKLVCTHPQFKLHLNSIAWYCDLSEIPVHWQLAVYKVCFEEASKQVLSHIQHNVEESIQAKSFAFSSMSMCGGLTMLLWQRSCCKVLSLPKCIFQLLGARFL